ncbi:uncharacterized protein K02A2.6-like [Copidosoma floridanum]|uniref:uncharacterized protein K02A2.6-like n=1 Tax=Copidosoma floridanum TaxID=29053 RepID=UPI0006C9C0CD|nr:uncharacterized protein K02A2.6-like [Copidosoma floridanum]
MCPIGQAEVSVVYKGCKRTLELFVVPGKNEPIMGLEWAWALGVLKENLDGAIFINKIDEASLKHDFGSVFVNELGLYNRREFNVVLKSGAVPVFRKPRSVPYAIKGKVEAELDRLVKEGILVPVECSEWATPIATLFKKNGQVRLRGDLKVTLNPVTKVDRYPIPRVQDVLAALKGHAVE